MKVVPLLITAALLSAPGLMGASRLWTNAAGKTLQAEFCGIEQTQVRLRLADGNQVLVPLAQLSAEDQSWLQNQSPSAVSGPQRMPETVKETLLNADIRAMVEKPQNYVYESAHFRFRTTEKLGTALLKDVSRAFESTYELVRQMPWGIQPKPEEGRTKFEAVLHVNREAYLQTGAPTWSSGIYSLKDKVFHIPYEEIGVAGNAGASGYFRKGAINNDTITHEITHQMMHALVPCMPIWLVEGLAEYTSQMPYRNGEFRVAEDGSVFQPKSRRTRGLMARLAPKASWLGVKETWELKRSIADLPDSLSANGFTLAQTLGDRYHSSHVLAYFFVRDLNGQPLRRFLEAIQAEAPKWQAFGKELAAYQTELEKLRPAFETYESELADFLKLPEVTKLPDGRIAYPATLTPPSPPPQVPKPPLPPDGTSPDRLVEKHLDLLLNGRSLEEVESQCRALFAKLGYALEAGRE